MGVHFKLILGNIVLKEFTITFFFFTSDFIFGYKERKDFAGKKVFQAHRLKNQTHVDNNFFFFLVRRAYRFCHRFVLKENGKFQWLAFNRNFGLSCELEIYVLSQL